MVGCGAVQSSGCPAHLTASASTSSSPSATAWHTICKQTPWASCTQVQLVRWQAMPQLALAAAALQRRVALCEHGCSPGASAQPHLAHAAHDGSHTAGVRAAAERQQEAACARPAAWAVCLATQSLLLNSWRRCAVAARDTDWPPGSAPRLRTANDHIAAHRMRVANPTALPCLAQPPPLCHSHRRR